MVSGKHPAKRVAAALLLVISAAGCAASTNRYDTLRRKAYEPARLGSDVDPESSSEEAAPTWTASELLLDELLQAAERRNPTLSAMRAAWQAAVERYPQVTALSDPQLGYSLAPGTIDSDSSIYGQKVELSQHLPWPGKLDLRGQAALSTAEAARDDFEEARARLVRAVTEAFYAYQFVHRAIDINKTNQGLLLEFQRIAESRYAAGLASKSDALQAEVEHQHLVHRGIELERQRAVAQARLNTLLKFAPKRNLPAPSKEIAAPTALPPLASLEQVTLESRPELQALAHSVDARSREVDLARREYFPDFSVSAGYNSLWEQSDKRTLVGVSINVPLQLERRRAALRQAQAEQRRAEARLEEARTRALLEVSEAFDELVEASHVVRLYRMSIIPAARESLETARTGYEAASNDFLTLVATEKALYLAELTHEQALTRYHQGLARLEYAAGIPLEQLEDRP